MPSWAKATPPGSGASTPVSPLSSNERVHSMEAAVNGWMHLIKDVLSATSESAFQVPCPHKHPQSLNTPEDVDG